MILANARRFPLCPIMALACKEHLRSGPSVTKHCRKSPHSRTKVNLWVIQIQRVLWSKLKKPKPFFSRNKELYLRFKRASKRNFAWSFHKAWLTKGPGVEVDRLPSPTPTKTSFVSTNDHWSVNKNSKVEFKIYEVEFEIWRGHISWSNVEYWFRYQN